MIHVFLASLGHFKCTYIYIIFYLYPPFIFKKAYDQSEVVKDRGVHEDRDIFNQARRTCLPSGTERDTLLKWPASRSSVRKLLYSLHLHTVSHLTGWLTWPDVPQTHPRTHAPVQLDTHSVSLIKHSHTGRDTEANGHILEAEGTLRTR